MQILIIGAGAVGSAYGYYASIAGNRVSYSIKPKYRASLERGMTLYHWKGRRAETIRFEGYELFDSIDALRGKTFDAVLVTLPSDKLKEGEWFERLLTVVGDAKIWSLQPNATDIEWIAEKIGKNADARLVWGRIPILSYLAPLPGEGFEKPGYAFYLPPGAKALWSSKTPALAEGAAKTFEAGGLTSKATATPGSRKASGRSTVFSTVRTSTSCAKACANPRRSTQNATASPIPANQHSVESGPRSSASAPPFAWRAW
jgi:2-dehydropantoate 2-reductase